MSADGSAPPRVLHIITGLHAGGAETMLCNVLAANPQLGGGAAVVSLQAEGPLAQRLRALSIPVTCLDLPPGRCTPRALRQLSALARQFQPQVVHGWMYHSCLAAWWARRSRRPPPRLVWNIRCMPASALPWNTRLVRGTLARMAATADRVLFNSHRSLAAHQRLGFSAARCAVIDNGFDTELYRPNPPERARIRRELGVNDDALLVGMVARCHPVKDHRTCLRALALAAPRQPRLRLVLAGRGANADNHELLREVNQAGFGSRVLPLGERTDVAAVLAALDLATSSSTSEGFPNVMGEAMSAGLPVVATDVGDTARLVGAAGTVVAPGDPAALAEAWCALLALPREQRDALGAAARLRVETEFSIARAAAQYHALHRDLARGA